MPSYFGSVTLHWMIFSSPQAAWTITLTLGLQLRRKQKKKKNKPLNSQPSMKFVSPRILLGAHASLPGALRQRQVLGGKTRVDKLTKMCQKVQCLGVTKHEERQE